MLKIYTHKIKKNPKKTKKEWTNEWKDTHTQKSTRNLLKIEKRGKLNFLSMPIGNDKWVGGGSRIVFGGWIKYGGNELRNSNWGEKQNPLNI